MTADSSNLARNAALDTEDSIALRLSAYLSERFPLLANGLLILSFYSSNQFLAHALNGPGEPMRYDLSSLLGYITILCFFLHIRIFDDHKDYAADCRHFSHRVLQRGIVRLRELRTLGVLAIGCEIVLAAICGPAALLAVLVALAFSVLMLKEFFLGDWLKQRFLLYASIHMLIMPLLAMTIWSFATRQYLWQIPSWYWLYSLVSYFLAFNWEVSRKIRVPENEIEGVDSYTRRFGTYGAAYLVLLIRVISTILVAMVAYHLGLSVWFYMLLVLLFLACLVGFLQYRLQTSPKSARRMETYAGIYILVFDMALAFELGSTFGLQISGTL